MSARMPTNPSSHPLLDARTAGVLLHPTSLPSRQGAVGLGDLGPGARKFIDWMKSAGLSRWQMLPVGPVGKGDSPYSGLSSFAIEPMLLSIEDLAEDGLLPKSAARTPNADDTGRASWPEVRRWKNPQIARAFETFKAQRGFGSAGYRRFRRVNDHWLTEWCGFAVERSTKHTGDDAGGDLRFHAFIQYQLDRQWSRLRAHARRHHVRLVGDLPIFCGADSADVAGHPELFRLDRSGRPSVFTGCPPDAFTRDGQLWGHPHYRWPNHRREGFSWWRRRVRATLDRFDLVRVDHFIGFVQAFEIPGDAANARRGRWRRTPGRELLTALQADLGPLPFLAEDLGAVTPEVTRLRQDFGLPGMRILQWGFHDPSGLDGPSKDLPQFHPADAVVYPGTHDNDTVAGWWRSLDRQSRERFTTYAGDHQTPSASMTRLAFTSPARTAIVQMQDLLELGRSARMNVPGRPRGNWTWRMRRVEDSRSLARKLHGLIAMSGRLPTD